MVQGTRCPRWRIRASTRSSPLVTRFAGSPKLKKVHVRALDLLNELEESYFAYYVTTRMAIDQAAAADG